MDRLGPAVAEILSAAKFGRDRFPAAWAQLLRLGCRVHANAAAVTAGETVSKEITEVFGSAPMNYSSRSGGSEEPGYVSPVEPAAG